MEAVIVENGSYVELENGCKVPAPAGMGLAVCGRAAILILEIPGEGHRAFWPVDEVPH